MKYQPFEVESWSRGTIKVTIGSSIDKLKPIKSVSLAYSPIKVNKTLEVVDMGNGLEEDYLNNPNKVVGKFALVYLGVLPGSKPGTPNLHRSEKTAIATKYGAKGIIKILKAKEPINPVNSWVTGITKIERINNPATIDGTPLIA